MKLNKNIMALATAAAFSFSGQAFAEGTAAGTTIQNTVTLGYTVNTVPQDNVTQNASFLVDTKVDFNLTNDESTTVKVTPNGNNYVSTFTLTSASNDTLDFDLSSADLASGSQSFLTGTVTDNIDLNTSLSIFVEEGTTAGYQSGTDTATSVNDLDADANIKVYVVVTTAIGATLTDADIAAIALTADALQSDGSAIPSNNADTFVAGTKQFVIADADLDASETTNTAFEVGTARFTDPDDATDTAKFKLDVTVINDPMCDTGLTSASTADYTSGSCPNAVMGASYIPKAIPGAMVEFTLKAKNSGSIDATDVTFSKDLSTVTDNDPLIAFAIVQNSLNTANVGVTFTKGPGTNDPTRSATDSSTTNELVVDVDTFETDDTIEITFTAIVE